MGADLHSSSSCCSGSPACAVTECFWVLTHWPPSHPMRVIYYYLWNFTDDNTGPGDIKSCLPNITSHYFPSRQRFGVKLAWRRGSEKEEKTDSDLSRPCRLAWTPWGSPACGTSNEMMCFEFKKNKIIQIAKVHFQGDLHFSVFFHQNSLIAFLMWT